MLQFDKLLLLQQCANRCQKVEKKIFSSTNDGDQKKNNYSISTLFKQCNCPTIFFVWSIQSWSKLRQDSMIMSTRRLERSSLFVDPPLTIDQQLPVLIAQNASKWKLGCQNWRL
ncbi:hypothetical protein T11_9558 [Trichinella zimbabwensis]|uniref:Uncharacterized protein n=1 Tax=Trichinella zimbabwensis TaxID=268475 RepID=A0A0V1HGU5_9BILA|nr:hypothetical protein T11_9558 [Trichinella zimbabwensis]